MAKTEYIAHLKSRLRDLESRVTADRKQLAEGSAREKVEAAGDLALVEKHLAETKTKLAKLEAEPEGAWEDFKAEVEEDLGALDGSFDRGGGPVWRARDGRNYYVARWNPLEHDCRIYTVVDGVRTTIPLFQDLVREPDIADGAYDIRWLETFLARRAAESD